MKFEKIFVITASLVLAGAFAACSKAKVQEQAPSGVPTDAKIEVQTPADPDSKQISGRVTAFNGTKITIDVGEIQQDTSGDNGNGRQRSGFKSTGKTETYDISGLIQITVINGREKTNDTIDKIKTGSFVVLQIGKDGNVTSLTLRSFGGRNRGDGNGNGNGSGKRDRTNSNSRPDRDRNGERSRRNGNGNGNNSGDGADA